MFRRKYCCVRPVSLVQNHAPWHRCTRRSTHFYAQSVHRIIASSFTGVNGCYEGSAFAQPRVSHRLEEKLRGDRNAFLLATTNPSWIPMTGSANIRLTQIGIGIGAAGAPMAVCITPIAAW